MKYPRINQIAKRIFDFTVSLIGLILLSPFFLLIAIIIKLDSKGPVFYKQKRFGKGGKEFNLIKFRTMHVNADKYGKLTVGMKDPRVTRVGYFLRKYKLDELPQLINVLKGDMSLVGPRPELKYRVEKLPPEYKRIYYEIKPGITCYASIEYIKENELLEKANLKTPEEIEDFYMKNILPDKIKLNMKYLERPTIFHDIKLILMTIGKILKLR